MNTSQIYIAISIAALAIVAILVLVVNRKREDKKITPLVSLAFGFIVAGLVFGDVRLIGYSVMGVGVILAIIDIVQKLKNK